MLTLIAILIMAKGARGAKAVGCIAICAITLFIDIIILAAIGGFGAGLFWLFS